MSCLAGVNILTSLGLNNKDLIPVTAQIKSADNDDILLLGAIFIELESYAKNKKEIEYSVPSKAYVSIFSPWISC